MPHVYLAYWQVPHRVDARVQVRVAGDPAAMLPVLLREVNKVDPAVPISETVTLRYLLAGGLRPLRMSATMVTYAGGLVLVLSALGLYGALAFAVCSRTREIGIRMAIGASPRGILVSTIGEGMIVVGLGVAVGIALAAAGVAGVVGTCFSARPPATSCSSAPRQASSPSWVSAQAGCPPDARRTWIRWSRCVRNSARPGVGA